MWRIGFVSLVATLVVTDPALAQTGRITGTVTAADAGTPIVGAQVRIVGRPIGAVTREDGHYTIVAPPGTYVLRATRIGYAPDSSRSVVVTADQETTVDFHLAARAVSLSTVAVVGYGTQAIRDVTGSVAAVDSSQFNKGVVFSPEQLIRAKVPGVQVMDNNEPGGGPTVRIRGGTSINASNDPLYVVDGVPLTVGGGATIGRNPLNFLNPNDIESITVLKDASSTAIYGSRGANGVVVITTKTGRGGPQLSYTGTVTGSRAVGQPDFLSAAQLRTAVSKYAPQNLSLLGNANTNWLKAVEQNAGGTEQNVDLAGSRQDMNYRLGLGYLDQSGVLQGSKVQRASASLNYSDRMFDDHFRLRAHVKGSRSKDQFTPGGVLGNATVFAATQPIYSTAGQYYEFRDASGQLISLAPNNPLYELHAVQDAGSTLRSVGNVEGEYELPWVKGLTATVRGGYDVLRGDRTTFTPSYLTSQLKADSAHRGDFYRNSPAQQNTVLDAYGAYRRELAQFKGTLDLTAGYSTERFRGDYPSMNLRGLQTDLLGSYGLPAAFQTEPFYTVDEYRLVSSFGRANLDLLDRYLFTATFRRDGSSKFAKGNQYGTFPSAAFAWRMLNEPMLKDRLPLSDLKFRVSWGKNGNQAVGNYLAYTSYQYGQSTAEAQLGNVFVPTIRPGASDPNLRWEKTTSTNLGLDYGFLQSRITGSIDWYTKKTSDLLFNVPTAAGTALSNYVTTNIGSVQNRGLELSIDARVLEPKSPGGFSYDANFNAFTNRNRLLSIDRPGITRITTGGIAGGVGNTIQVLQPGQPINSFLVYHQIGDTSGVPIYQDLNGDKIINEKDLRPFHSPAPTWILGHTSTLAWHGFDASATLRAYIGNYVYNNLASNLGHYSNLSLAAPISLQSSVLKYGFVREQYFSDVYVEKASFLRMDNITVGYTFNRLANLANARVFGTIQNAFTVTGYSGVDPATNVNGIDNNIYPLARTFVGGLSVNF